MALGERGEGGSGGGGREWRRRKRLTNEERTNDQT
jgi:hypothetical protein